MMFHKNQEHETADGLDAGKYMAQYFSVLNLLHYTTLHFTTLHYTTLHFTTLHFTTRWRAVSARGYLAQPTATAGPPGLTCPRTR